MKSIEPLSSFFFCRKLHMIFLFFVYYRVIQLRYFWWHYFLNDFGLLDDFWDWFVYWFYIATSSWLSIESQNDVGTFSDDARSSTTVFVLLAVRVSIKFFFWTPFIFFFFGSFYLSSKFSVISLSFNSWIFCHLPGNLFLMLFWMIWMLVTMNKHVMCHTCPSQIITKANIFTEIFSSKDLAVRPKTVTRRKKRKRKTTRMPIGKLFALH